MDVSNRLMSIILLNLTGTTSNIIKDIKMTPGLRLVSF